MTRITEAAEAWELGYRDGHDDGTWGINPEFIPNPFQVGTTGYEYYSQAYAVGYEDGSHGIYGEGE